MIVTIEPGTNAPEVGLGVDTVLVRDGVAPTGSVPNVTAAAKEERVAGSVIDVGELPCHDG